ncbi:MAG: recombinase family protein [Candidatus Gracilibacteria bacterium]|nr:recombinase family protein [Candidatus Gracilibacteria bacterium]
MKWSFITGIKMHELCGKCTLNKSRKKVFNDEGISGGVFERKSIKELISYIDSNKEENSYTVIFEDLNRLSRDIQVHHLLRTEFRKRGVELQCPNFQFEETPEGTFRENMSVSMAQGKKEKTNKESFLDKKQD